MPLKKVFADFGKVVWSPTSGKKNKTTDAVTHECSPRHIYYEPPEDLEWEAETAASTDKGIVHSRETCAVCSDAPPSSTCTNHFSEAPDDSRAFTQEEFTSAILARTHTGPSPCLEKDVSSCLATTASKEETLSAEQGYPSCDKRCSATSCCSSCSKEGESDGSAPHRCQGNCECCEHQVARKSKGDAGDYAACSPMSERRAKGGMLGRLKNLTTRTSYSTSEDGHSHSSDYEDQEEAERKIELKMSRESGGRSSSWTGRMRDLHRDVKRRISRLRNTRSTPPETENRDGADNHDIVIQPGSSVESLPSGSGSSIQPPTPTSSNRSSTSAGEEENSPFVGTILGRARALVDCTPSPYDRDGLAFKKGDIIDIVAKHKTGIWVGMANGKVGHFKFINVEELSVEDRPRQRRHRLPVEWTLTCRKPESLNELLTQLELQEYLNVLILNGYEDLEAFKEIDEEDLDGLGIVNVDHRLMLLKAAKMLIGFEEVDDLQRTHSPRDSGCYASHENLPHRTMTNGQAAADQEDPDISQSESGIQSSDGPDSNTTINNLDISSTTAAIVTPLKSHYDSTEEIPSTSTDLPEDAQSIPYNIPPSEVTNGLIGDFDTTSAGFSLKESPQPQSDSLHASPEKSTHSQTEKKSSSFNDRIVINGCAPVRKTKSKKFREKNSSLPGSPLQSRVALSDSRHQDASTSPFHSPIHNWSVMPKKGRSAKKGQEYEDVLNGDSVAKSGRGSGKKNFKKSKQRKGSLQPLNRNPRPPSPRLMRALAQKLEEEGIDLLQEPYTDKTGFCGIPPALVQRYAEELQRDICDTADALDQTRINFLQQAGRRGVPNDFLADSCVIPVVEANYMALSSWLISLGLPMYEAAFVKAGVDDLSQVSQLSANDLRNCGIDNVRHIRFLSTALATLQAKFAPFPTNP